jgi:hypothetical protein
MKWTRELNLSLMRAYYIMLTQKWKKSVRATGRDCMQNGGKSIQTAQWMNSVCVWNIQCMINKLPLYAVIWVLDPSIPALIF